MSEHSALQGVIQRMTEAGIDPEVVEEIDRLLTVLRGQGWSGFIPSDEAVEALIDASRHPGGLNTLNVVVTEMRRASIEYPLSGDDAVEVIAESRSRQSPARVQFTLPLKTQVHVGDVLLVEVRQP